LVRQRYTADGEQPAASQKSRSETLRRSAIRVALIKAPVGERGKSFCILMTILFFVNGWLILSSRELFFLSRHFFLV